MEMCKVAWWLFTLLASSFALESPSRCSDSCLKLHPSGSGQEDNQLVKHCAKLTPEGRCECDWEKRLTPEGTCECLLPGHVVNSEYKCICQREKCPKIEVASGCTVQEPEAGECCPKQVCTCPEDSYMQDGRCVCYPCKIKTCDENMTVRKGNQTPGTCCDLYKCNNITSNEKKPCLLSDIQYQDGESWTQDCFVFNCINGIVFHNLLENCEKKSCVSGDKVYKDSLSWMEDECTNCTCINGEKKCVAHFCKDLASATIRPIEDCPNMDDCKKKCPFGYRVNRRGCETCKCKPPDVKIMQDILRKLNCTAEECEALHAETSICRDAKEEDMKQCPKCPEPAPSSTLFRNILLFSTLTLLIITIILLFLLRHERRDSGSCSLSTQDEEYTRIHLYDANLNQDNKPVLISAKDKPEKDYH